MFYLYIFISYLLRGINLFVVNLAKSMVSLYISIRSFNFFLSANPSSFRRASSFLASLSCLINVLKVGFSWGVVMSMTSICFSVVQILPLSFLLTGASIMTSCSTFSFLVDDLVKGILSLFSSATVGEGKSNFLLFFLWF
jgi:hypothetical protein